MIEFQATIEKFQQKGEKSGWTYIAIPRELATQLLPDNKKAFRVKGKLDHYSFEWTALVPMGGGDFILPLNAGIRKAIKKNTGALLSVIMEVDAKEKPLCAIFMKCLEDDPASLAFFSSLPKGHQRYFSNWIEMAKTDATKTKRIGQALNALSMGLGFSEMVRMNKNMGKELQ